MPETPATESAVEILGLQKSFDGKDFVLNDMNLKIPKGSLTVIIGFSGTGKSVLLKHILGLVKPTAGEINVLGQRMSSMSDEEITKFRCNFGVLFQNAALFDDMNVLENVCFPLEEHRRKLRHSEMVEIAVSRLKLVGLEPKH